MEKKTIFQVLEERRNDYGSRYPATGETDFDIFREYCSGKTTGQIATDMSCSEPAVYRALHRVRVFLKRPEETVFWDILYKLVADYMPNHSGWDAHSVLEMLYIAYSEHNRYESEDAQASYNALSDKLGNLSVESIDIIIDIVSDLCHSYEREAFIEGVKLGVQLADELVD